MLGDNPAAREAYRKEPNPMLGVTGLAIAEHRLGNAAAATAARHRVETGLGEDLLTYYQQAQIAAQWGEADRAMAALNSAVTALDSGMLSVWRDPLLEPLRQRPDYLRLINQLGFA